MDVSPILATPAPPRGCVRSNTYLKKKLIYAFMHGPKTIVKEMTQMRMYLNAAIHSFPGCSKNAGWACNIVNKFLAKFILIFMYINHITLHW